MSVTGEGRGVRGSGYVHIKVCVASRVVTFHDHRVPIERKRGSAECEIFDRLSAYKVFLNDSLKVFPGALSVPDPFRIDECDRTVDADAKALCLRTKHAVFYVNQTEFSEPCFQKGPTFGLQVTFCASSTDAQKDVWIDAREFELLRRASQLFVELH